jgi:CheY-like chemotaxis protein
VLVADDDRDSRDLLVAIAESHGYDAIAVTNGAEALEAIRSKAPPALVLLDVGMPILNGWAFLDEKERDPAIRSIPVIVVSGQGDVAERAAQAHVGYLPKPVSMTRLLKMMADASSRPASKQA